MRRTQGVKAGRNAFKRAREDERTRFHVYIAAALMEYYCSKVSAGTIALCSSSAVLH